MKMLLKHKAYADARDNLGQTALILACSVAMPQLDMVRALISARANVSARMNNRHTALHLASAKNEAGEFSPHMFEMWSCGQQEWQCACQPQVTSGSQTLSCFFQSVMLAGLDKPFSVDMVSDRPGKCPPQNLGQSYFEA